MTAPLVFCEQTTSSAMCGPFTLWMLTASCASPSPLHSWLSILLSLPSNIIDSDPKKQPKGKRGAADVAEPQRARGYQPYSTSSPRPRRSVTDAVANYDFTQPPQAQPQAFFAHGQGQRYGAYGKVVHRLRVLIQYRVAWRWYGTGACGLCLRRCLCLSRTSKRWKTRRWEDSLSSLLNPFVIIALSRISKTDHSDTSAPNAKLEINCIVHHVSNFF